MDQETLIEFLGQVPLLQRLPSSSLRKIADVIQVRRYEPGDYVVREGECGLGLYFIWEGQAEVSRSGTSEEGNRSDLQLKQYDYFGYVTKTDMQSAILSLKDVISIFHTVYLQEITEYHLLICLVLPDGYKNLLQPKSIWNAEGTPKDFSLVEHILHLEPLDVDIFRGFSLPDAPSFGQVFGGQLIGQTTYKYLFVSTLLAIVIFAVPIIYQVQRARDGKSFATRKVEARQHGTTMFILLASFQKVESGFEHQEVLMPCVPGPETLLSLEELRERRITDPRLPMHYRNTVVARTKFIPWPIEIKFCDSSDSSKQALPSLKYWFKARGKLSDDAALHSIWFHRPVRADDWLLYVIESPSASGGRGFVTGHMFNQKGELIVSLTQECLIRKPNQESQVPHAKL